jgi:hypothetical protein
VSTPVVKCTLTVFVVPAATGQGPSPPGPPTERQLEAKDEDALFRAARQQLVEEGYRIRALSFGSRGLVAYVEERA